MYFMKRVDRLVQIVLHGLKNTKPSWRYWGYKVFRVQSEHHKNDLGNSQDLSKGIFLILSKISFKAFT